jgi:hypothetical protein
MTRPDEARTVAVQGTNVRFVALNSRTTLNRLYWCMRLGIGFVWIWTAFVSWYLYPHSSSLELLRVTGMTAHTELVFAGACLLDLVMGIASCVYAAPSLWWSQFLIVGAYSVVIGIFLPEFLVHPFGPIVKNIPVLACLAFLALADRR